MPIKSKADLIKKMDEVAKRSLIKLGNEIKVTWRHYIQTKFYDQYQPIQYERTYALLNSVVTTNIYKIGDIWKIDIYMDDSDVYYKYDDPRFVFNLVSEGIHGLPEKGDGGWVNPHFIQTDGRFYEAIINDLENGVFREEFGKILSDMGLKLTVRH